jgi:hypothetical protein
MYLLIINEAGRVFYSCKLKTDKKGQNTIMIPLVLSPAGNESNRVFFCLLTEAGQQKCHIPKKDTPITAIVSWAR